MKQPAAALESRTALVTGGGTGIGKATAVALAAAGAAVVVMGRRAEPLAETVAAIEADGGRALAVRGDVTSAADGEAAVAAAVAAYGGLHILFNNAGIVADGDALEIGMDLWETALAINLTGPLLMCRAAIPEMRRQGGGAIINNASTLGLVGLQRSAAYCAAKAGLVGLTRAMALDHAPEKIRINAVCPAVIDTVMPRRRNLHGADRPALDAAYGHLHALGRVGGAEEVAALVVFLASDAASFITGTAIPVDGGLTAL